MNSKQIINSLEYCLKQGITSECERCEVKSGCRATLIKNALDLINRQNTEIDIIIRKKEDLGNKICELQSEIERLKEIEFMYNSLLE